MTKIDHLIIGQGLAGSLLAYQLIQLGQRVMVVDNNLFGSSSKVAAGLINPITGHRLNLNDDFFDNLRTAKEFYTSIETQLKQTFLSQLTQKRLIKNAGQHSYLSKRLDQIEYQELIATNSGAEFKQNEFGAACINHTYMVNTKALLNELKAWLQQQQSYRAFSCSYEAIETSDFGIKLADIHAKNIVFCEGYQAINNPWLKHLPFKLAKGEILTLELDMPVTQMLSWGNWLVPELSLNSAKLGANYAWNDTELKPTDGVREALLDSLQQHTFFNARVRRHEVGIRPTTTARKAFVGPLSNLKNAYCFNGFGSKGCLTIPSHVQLLSEHLMHNSPLPLELSQCL